MSSILSRPTFDVSPHPVHGRLRSLTLAPEGLRAFLAATAHVDLQQLAYVPYMRFVVADELERGFPGLLRVVQEIARERATGGFTASIGAVTADPADFVRFATAFAHLLGPANFDAMSGSYYARFIVQHEDASDSYLRQAYHTMTLHTDGTYVNEATDYLLMMKFTERHAVGGESRILHLDDWDDLETMLADPAAHVPMAYVGSASKNVGEPAVHPTFYRRADGWCISFIDQFARPHTIAEATFLDRMLRSMEASPGTVELPLPVGELIVLNNAFWMHGRAAFRKHRELHRELLRIRGAFAEQ